MTHNDDLPNNNNGQFALSYELLCLLQWLVEYDQKTLKKIVAKALRAGLSEEIQKIDNPYTQGLTKAEDMQHSIIDFFGLLETLLAEVVSEQLEQKAREKNLMPAIDQIDTTICDDATVRSSLERATNKVEHNPNINAKEQLFKELLKRWKPHNKNVVN